MPPVANVQYNPNQGMPGMPPNAQPPVLDNGYPSVPQGAPIIPTGQPIMEMNAPGVPK